MATVDILCVRATAVSVLAGDTTPGFADCDDSGAGGALLDRPQVPLPSVSARLLLNSA